MKTVESQPAVEVGSWSWPSKRMAGWTGGRPLEVFEDYRKSPQSRFQQILKQNTEGDDPNFHRYWRQVSEDLQQWLRQQHGAIDDYAGEWLRKHGKVIAYEAGRLFRETPAIQQLKDQLLRKSNDPKATGKAVRMWLADSGPEADAALLQQLVHDGVMTKDEANNADVESGAREHRLVHIFVWQEQEQRTLILEVDPDGSVEVYRENA